MRVGVFSPGIFRIPHLRTFLDADSLVFRPRRGARVDAVVGWGRKASALPARRYAARTGVPFLCLEDGFLRSLDLAKRGAPPRSLVVDRSGIYYDATRPSDLETWLAEEELEEAERTLANQALPLLRRLSKYNHQPDFVLPARSGDRVLVVAQTPGDLSLRLGRSEGSLRNVVETALDEHPDAEVWVKVHPDVLHQGKGPLALPRDPRVILLGEEAHPPTLLPQFDHVYVQTSQVGFEALLAGVPVTCFGAPWYSGWGLTDDRVPTPRRKRERTLLELVAFAYLRYARYIDPESGERTELLRAARLLGTQRRVSEQSAGTTICYGFSRWKRAFVPAFLAGPRSRVVFASTPRHVRRTAQASRNARILVWGRGPSGSDALGDALSLPVWRMEDGFLRSVGLGSDLLRPASLVVDGSGLYYDPRRPSDLETLLEETEFGTEELERASALRAAIVERRISKYVVGARTRITVPSRSPVALVIGQVDDDASVQLGTLDISSNEALLREVRRARPDAHLLYKPHPDVVSGNRRGDVRTTGLADQIITSATLDDCLDVATEVHTMTSLVGFEALLRDLDVHVYGMPFYAGWGLTTDRMRSDRRTRSRTLNELVAATLLRYPRYIHPDTGTITTPESIVDALARKPPASIRHRPWVRRARKARNLALALLPPLRLRGVK